MAKAKKTDVILIGAGIMSATLGTLLRELAPDWRVTVFEKLDGPGQESSNEWNNAGTGHSALCELNYTVERSDGSMDISKAVRINEQFQISRQFWSYLVRTRQLTDPRDFIRPIPHMSLVSGKKDAAFLRKRYEALAAHPLFEGMEYSEDRGTLARWMPLVLEGRGKETLAATRIESGTDVNFGALTRLLMENLEQRGAEVRYNCAVRDLARTSDGLWEVKVRARSGRGYRTERHLARFVFIGAGGGSLPLLQKSGISEGKGIGGFPISGLFMVCKNPEVVEKHHAKVYSKAKVGAPPMSVPHLDTRWIGAQESLLFGPFAGFSPKFLKSGSILDLPRSLRPHNLSNMLCAAVKEFPLVRYLIGQLLLTDKQRMKALREFVPTARPEDWDLLVAGQRVQVIRETAAGGKGTLQFGTEVVHAADGSVAALLGASPGASVAVDAMLDVLERCFPQEFAGWQAKIREMIPSFGRKLAEDPALFRAVREETDKTLRLR